MRRSTIFLALALVAMAAPAASAETPASLCGWIFTRHDNNWGITLADTHTVTVNAASTALQNIKDCKQGNLSVSGDGCPAAADKVQLRQDMLLGIQALRRDKNFTFRISEIAGGAHECPDSWHYKGRAIDVSRVNGTVVSLSTQHRPFGQACTDLGADQVLGPWNDPEDHDDHIHCAWLP